MKKITTMEQMKVIGGASVSQVCKGTHRVTRVSHSLTITGTGSTTTAAKKDFNSKLSSHKASMGAATHSATPYSV